MRAPTPPCRCLTCRKRKTRCAGERPICSTCISNGHDCLGYTDLAEKKKELAQRGSGSNRAKNPAAHVKREYDDELDPDESADSASPNSGPLLDNTDDDDDDDGDRNGKGRRLDGRIRRRKSSGSSQGHSQSQSGQDRDRDHDTGRSHRPSYQKHDKQQNASGQRSQRSVSFREGSQGNATRRSPSQHMHQHQHHNESHRVPYFRYFGPTAIVPGYKQMVVDVSVRDRHRSRGSSFSTASPRTAFTDGLNSSGAHRGRHGNFDTVFENLEDIPVYDPSDSGAVHPLIISLVKTFFVNLGCNYPFLREARVLRMVREKRAEAYLVDAMCSLAARFSDLPIFSNGNGDTAGDGDGGLSRSEFGHVFAQRAKASTVDTFPCPSVAAVQANLLMAYESFGADQDSALWMYLGISIRMAVDLGLQKKISVAHQGESDPWLMRSWAGKDDGEDGSEDEDDEDDGGSSHTARKKGPDNSNDEGAAENEDRMSDAAESRDVERFRAEELRAAEQERADTFWAVFFLDRVISSGTGRPVTFRDDDFELALPEPTFDPTTGWPAPFPILVQIINIYGRVSDILNNIRSVDDLTQEKMQRLGHMENELTQLYQRQDLRLNFNANNFQAYVRAGQSTTFILLHFWFHALIIILHQPTLLTPFGGLRNTRQLLPNSHELSMSSAKTIADILAFAELIDPKSFIGNPFTSQPMYIAACAFLMESIVNASLPASRDTTPPSSDQRFQARGFSGARTNGNGSGGSGADARTFASSKHSLLASNANQNYQRCYKSLQQLHRHWGGVRYILTALDQKSKGIWDCETFTSEDVEGLKEPPHRGRLSQMPRFDIPTSPKAPPIAWSLTGTSNSANPSVTLLYQSHPNTAGPAQASHEGQDSATAPNKPAKPQQQQEPQAQPPKPYQSPQPLSASTPPGNMIYDPIRQSLPEVPAMLYGRAYPQANVSAVRYSAQVSGHSQEQQYQQQNGSQHSLSFSESPPTAQGPGRAMYDYEEMQHDNQQQQQQQYHNPHHHLQHEHGHQHQHQNQYHHHEHQHQHQNQHGHQHELQHQHPPQQLQHQQLQHNQQQQNHDQQLHQGYMQQQHGDGGHNHGQPQQGPQHPLPVPVPSYNTPSSNQSPSYDGTILPDPSPPSNGLGEYGQAGVGGGVTHGHAAGIGQLDGNGLYQPDLSQGGLASGPFHYIETGPITEIITFDSQEVDLSSLALPVDMMPQWLEYVPSNVMDLFDENATGEGQ